MPDEIRVPVASDGDILLARQYGREIAAQLAFSVGEQATVATAISEIARNIIQYAGRGEMVLYIDTDDSGRQGIVIIARDEGPGIADVELAMQDGYSTSGGLGLGLPGARRLMDEFEVVSELGKGTTVTMRKWGA